MKTLLATFLFIALAATSCKNPKSLAISPAQIAAGTWQLSEIFGQSANAEDYMKGLPSMTFGTDGKLSGTTGCNMYNGNFSLEGNALKLAPGAMTKMSCPGNGEANFLRAVSQVVNAKIDGSTLTLLDAGKQAVMLLTLQD